ncbi:hypothetical protein OW493_02880 [Cobetia sp. 14N.309.X.WAT.E.A4]|uniref:toxin-antitoxin system YwqK family antitoxin n=1 Tax=Cobetia sp. 14N.309.X.WAT.E.A4 TaxID=2998323 RepID=UPI0025B0AE8A|nr:hypothetical protein [Cobetia sp. 14N.309.X.WAT.E.A4]MDN2655390.1 hypothetical protein [Cobetia sp. 14N.309.X.WAT.E.A4]
MGLIKNISRAVTSTCHAIDNGAKELDNIAGELEKSSVRYLHRNQISRLKDEIKRLQALPDQYDLIINKKEEMLIEYDMYIEVATGDEIKNYIDERRLLEIELTDEKLKKTFIRLNAMETKILARKSRLAIEQIQALNNLSGKFIKLMDDSNASVVLGSEYAKNIFQKCRGEINNISVLIKKLETERVTEDIEIYSSGEMNFKISKRDDKPHGRSVYYFHNGSKNKIFSFNNGCLEGLSRCWREDGSLAVEYNFCSNLSSVKIATYTSYGIKVADGEIKNNAGGLRLWLWGGVYIGNIKIKDGRVKRKTAILKILMNPKFIALVCETLRSSEMKLEYKEFIDTVNLFHDFSEEIFSMSKS